MKNFAPASFLPRFGGRRASFKTGVVATLAIAVAANIAVLGNLGVLFGNVVPGASHRNLYEPYFQTLAYKSMPSYQLGIFRPVYTRFADSLKGRADTALYQLQGGKLKISASGNPIRFIYLNTTPSLADTLGVQVVAGRALVPADAQPGAAPVMVVSDRFARSHFGSANAALNQDLVLDGKNYRVVGVLPPALHFPSGPGVQGYTASAWVPFQRQAAAATNDIDYGLYAVVRPGSNLSVAALHAAFDRAYHQALHAYNADGQAEIEHMKLVTHVSTLAQREFGPVITRLQLLELAALLLLLLVLANLAGLATADTLARRHELATRVALGAGAWRLYAERARELCLLGVAGWVIGVGLGWLGSRALAGTVGQAGGASVFSWPVLVLTLVAVLVITALLAVGGLRRLRTPRALLSDLASGGHSTGGRGLVRTLRAFIVLQLAASVVLLVVAGHLHENVFGLTHHNLGFTQTQRSFIRVSLPGSYGRQTEAQYETYVKQARSFDNRFLERLNQRADIAHAATLTVIPFSGGTVVTDASTTSQGKSLSLNYQTVTQHIVPALGLHVLVGNPASIFTDAPQSIFIDQTAAEKFWPHTKPGDVIGRTLYINSQPRRVTAVVAPLRMKPYGSVGGTAFRPLAHSGVSGGPQGFVVQSTLKPQALRKALANVVQATNPQAKLVEFYSASELVTHAYAARSQLGRVFGALAIVAILIAAVGLFALLAYRSLVRRPEFAIRGAIGATPGRLLGTVLTEAGVLWAIGCVIGLPAAYALSIVLAHYLPALGLPTAWIAITVVIALGVTALFAAIAPARRAAGIDLAGNLTN
ncbi:MAG: ABC transporter permease [Gammaproteobacteria bacterium]